MSWARRAVAGLSLASLALAGCSMAEPAPKDFVLVDERPAKAEEKGNSLQTAEYLCKDQTKRKGMGSVLGIFSRLRKGSADEDYIACMKDRGYEVKP